MSTISPEIQKLKLVITRDENLHREKTRILEREKAGLEKQEQVVKKIEDEIKRLDTEMQQRHTDIARLETDLRNAVRNVA